MASRPFQFKQFAVSDEWCTHKVGTDAVLLGSWVTICQADKQLLDVGTGSGVIALMLAQRAAESAVIDAIDIDEQDVRQARQNVLMSPWPQKVRVIPCSIQEYTPGKVYDLIVSNPPYFVNSLLPPDARRQVARHTRTLSFEDLLNSVVRLLAPEGRLAVVLPYVEGQEFIRRAEDCGLFPARHCTFRARANKPPERLLLEFSRSAVAPQDSDLVLYGSSDNWSEAYRLLTGAFYLDRAERPSQ